MDLILRTNSDGLKECKFIPAFAYAKLQLWKYGNALDD